MDFVRIDCDIRILSQLFTGFQKPFPDITPEGVTPLRVDQSEIHSHQVVWIATAQAFEVDVRGTSGSTTHIEILKRELKSLASPAIKRLLSKKISGFCFGWDDKCLLSEESGEIGAFFGTIY